MHTKYLPTGSLQTDEQESALVMYGKTVALKMKRPNLQRSNTRTEAYDFHVRDGREVRTHKGRKRGKEEA